MTAEVLFAREGQAARIRLNRPKAIHALTLGMTQAINSMLDVWRVDEDVAAIIIDHAEGRGFCAGGDIRQVAESAASDGAMGRDFFFDEYRMNNALFTFPKPIVAFMDGITLGGGVGISQPARYRVATENTRLAMPESGIGLFPDVGGGWYLSRLPGRLGAYLALTGARLDGADCLALGLATHYLPVAALDEAKQRIAAEPGRIDDILASLSTPPPEAPILAEQAEIDRLFASDRLEDIVAALTTDGGEWAVRTLAVLKTKSPQTCKISLRLLREGATIGSFAEEMAKEYAIASRVIMLPDFVEGVRAVIVDKDNAPRWNPATPEEVTDAQIDAIFAPLPPAEAWTPND